MNNSNVINITTEWEQSLLQSIYIAEKISEGKYETQDLEALLQILQDLRVKVSSTKEMSKTKSLR